MRVISMLIALGLLAVLASCQQAETSGGAGSAASSTEAGESRPMQSPAAAETKSGIAMKGEVVEKVSKSNQEWKEILTPEQYHVLREKGTERAFTGKYAHTKEDGIYCCAACHLELFDSDTKFESGTGWPSFYQPLVASHVEEETDVTLGMRRVEALCARCGGHLGHVFDDGPQPTGLRYCLNSAALELVPKKP